MEPLDIDGAYLYVPAEFPDRRGSFWATYLSADLAEVTGSAMPVAQVNCISSHRGAIRGIHFSEVPGGQAKYVTCVVGTVFDVVVDLRVGSPTFGRWQGIRLAAEKPRGLYLAEGLGHAVLALTEGATVSYLCSTAYNPAREHGVHPLDPQLGIGWPIPADDLILSDKDRAAPTLANLLDAGVLPDFAVCGAPR
jgi:dTDP-4-dehydrorhamnose 3,5-epimerase